MSDPKPEYPVSEPGDPEEVVLALETGRALWGQGDHRDAIRWLQKAAMKALQTGHHVRAAVLTRTAAEFGSSLTIRPAAPAPPSGTVDLDGEYADKTIVDRLGEGGGRQRQVSSPGLPSPRMALRVAVSMSQAEPTALMVRVLSEGQAVPAGAHEALLVALEPGADFFKSKA